MRGKLLAFFLIVMVLFPLSGLAGGMGAEAADDEPAAEAACPVDAVTISLLGDCSIGDSAQYIENPGSYHSVVDQNGYAWPFSLVSEYLKNDDLTVANLEVVLTASKRHTNKTYYLKAEPDHVQVLLEGGVDMVNTVNNHCMDFYPEGYQDTLRCLDDAGIGHFGSVFSGGRSFDDLGIAELNGIRVGFIGVSYPQDTDQKKIAARIQKLREEENCDIVIVSLHWGRETYMTPSSWQLPYARKIIDAGADAIYGHHAHVIQPIQFYKNKPILYSTGNFTFGTMSDQDPSTGIFQLVYGRNAEGKAELKRLRVIPCYTQGKPDYRPIEVTDPNERQEIFRKLTMKQSYKNCENPPASFLETGIVEFSDGNIIQ